ncbi:MAG: DUF2088 domain-containing protein [Abditibacteriota bacterium]|nr:DUF2088 domain-containing protein [Abditibacteriota bacterium]
MIVKFPYGETFAPAEVPDRNLISIYSKNNREPIEYEDIRDAAVEAIEAPVASPGLARLARGKRRAVIVADDNPQTPVRIIAPLIVSRLEAEGIQDIAFITASPQVLDDAEKQKRFGRKLCAKYPVLDHTPADSLSLRDLGYSESGTRIYVSNTATESDLLISIGQIAPSHISGFTGGADAVLPGLAGEETANRLYWESGLYTGGEILGNIQNPIRREMDLAAERAGLSFIVNCIINTEGEPVGFIAGDPVEAFKKGAEMAENVFGAYFHEHADIVICSSFPYDRDLWEASRALFAAGVMVKNGGVIILVSPCPEGVSADHSQIEELGYHGESETVAAVNNGILTDFAAFSHLLHVGRLIKEKASCIMVKNGIERDTVIKLGFKFSSTPQRAVDRALKLMGPGARIAVLGEGGKALPVYMQVARF